MRPSDAFGCPASSYPFNLCRRQRARRCAFRSRGRPDMASSTPPPSPSSDRRFAMSRWGRRNRLHAAGSISTPRRNGHDLRSHRIQRLELCREQGVLRQVPGSPGHGHHHGRRRLGHGGASGRRQLLVRQLWCQSRSHSRSVRRQDASTGSRVPSGRTRGGRQGQWGSRAQAAVSRQLLRGTAMVGVRRGSTKSSGPSPPASPGNHFCFFATVPPCKLGTQCARK